VKRWLVLVLGLAAAAGALGVLAAGRRDAQLGSIDAASKRSLERVLAEAEREGAPR
jgi:hypothetical protein